MQILYEDISVAKSLRLRVPCLVWNEILVCHKPVGDVISHCDLSLEIQACRPRFETNPIKQVQKNIT